MTSPQLVVCGIGSGMDRSLLTIRNMGYSPVVLTDQVTPTVRQLAEKIIEVYPRNLDAVLERMTDVTLRDPAGVLSLGYENPPVISGLAEKLGTPGLPSEVALNCTNKGRRIAILDSRGIRVPRYRAAGNTPLALAALEEIGRPAVVKPVDLTSSLGVARIGPDTTDSAIRKLIQYALHLSPSSRVLIEEYLEGTEHTVEGVRDHGVVHITGVSDRNYSEKHRFAPFFFDNGDTLPSTLDSLSLSHVIDECVRAAGELELDPAVFSCDVLRTHSGEVVILEVAGRMAGSRFGTEIVPLSTGIDVLPSAVRMSVGERVREDEVTPLRNRAVVLRYLAIGGGLVTEVSKLPSPATMGVYDLFWENRPTVGKKLPQPRSAKDIVAGAIADAESLAEAERLAASALASIRITVKES